MFPLGNRTLCVHFSLLFPTENSFCSLQGIAIFVCILLLFPIGNNTFLHVFSLLFPIGNNTFLRIFCFAILYREQLVFPIRNNIFCVFFFIVPYREQHFLCVFFFCYSLQGTTPCEYFLEHPFSLPCIIIPRPSQCTLYDPLYGTKIQIHI